MSAERHLLLTADAIGGVWQYSIDLADALRDFGYRTTIAVVGPEPSVAQQRKVDGIDNVDIMPTGLELEWLASSPEQVAVTRQRLHAMAGDLRVDVLQLHSPALVHSAPYSCPVVAVVHSCVATWWSAVRDGPIPDDFGWRTAQIAEGLRKADAIITPSVAFGEMVRTAYGVAPLAVHNGRKLDIVAIARRDEVFTAGRLWDDGKNVRLLDSIAERLHAPFRAAGPVRSPQGASIALKALDLLGSLDETQLAAHLGTRPIFTSAALYEPFGLSVLEAAIAGCPLVLSDIPTFRELWDGAAIFVSPDDVDGFVSVIEHMLEDMSARDDAGARAQARARRYMPASMAGHMAALYDQIRGRAAA